MLWIRHLEREKQAQITEDGIRVTFILLLVLLGFIAYLLLQNDAYAGRLFRFAMETEAQIYGLKRRVFDTGKHYIVCYDNGKTGKPVIVMLHGFSADKSVWARFARFLNDDYRVLIPDLPGHGDSGFDQQADYSIPSQSEAVRDLLDAAGIDKAHIIGNSMGGFIAAHFALSYGDRCITAGLFDPAGVPTPEASDMEKLRASGRNPFFVKSREEFEEFYAMTMAQPPWLPEFAKRVIAHDYMSRIDQLEKIFNDFFDLEVLAGKLGDIEVPVYLLWGEEDRLIHVSGVAVWSEQIGEVSASQWPGVGHMPMLELPERAAMDYQAFLDEH